VISVRRGKRRPMTWVELPTRNGASYAQSPSCLVRRMPESAESASIHRTPSRRWTKDGQACLALGACSHGSRVEYGENTESVDDCRASSSGQTMIACRADDPTQVDGLLVATGNVMILTQVEMASDVTMAKYHDTADILISFPGGNNSDNQ
jgi:hypothetical protein